MTVVVAGAGAAGMLGALVAAARGAEVILVEGDLHGPSNLQVSGGLFPVAGSHHQRAAGIDDTPEGFAADIRAKALGTENRMIVDAVANVSILVLEFMERDLAIPIHLAATVPAPGHRVPRLHATPAESGRDLHRYLRDRVSRSPRIRLLDHARVVSLVGTGGAVSGAVIEVPAGSRTMAAHAVLLATGGFAADHDLVARYLPGLERAIHIGAGPNDGSALRMGLAHGAAVATMDGYQGQGHVNPRGGTRLGMGLPLLGAFMVNRAGRRFVREDLGPSELGLHVLACDDRVAFEVYDARCHEAASRQGPYQEAVRAGNVMRADSIEALAELAGIDGPSLAATFEAFNACVEGRAIDPLGRRLFGPQLEAPFHGSWVTGALAHTQGGLQVDACGRVIRADGHPIPGLFAAGGAAAGLAGAGGEGYLPGNGLGQSFGLGFLAGETMAAGS